MFTFAKEIIPFIQDRVPKFVYAIIIFLIVTVESFSLLGINIFKDFDHTKTDHPIVHDYELVKKVQHLRIRNHASWTSIHLFHDDEGSLSIDVHQLENYKFSRIIESHEEILHPKKKKFTNIPISQYLSLITQTDEDGFYYVPDADSIQDPYIKNLAKEHLKSLSFVIIPLYDPNHDNNYVGFVMLEYVNRTSLSKEELYLIEKDCEYLESCFTTNTL